MWDVSQGLSSKPHQEPGHLVPQSTLLPLFHGTDVLGSGQLICKQSAAQPSGSCLHFLIYTRVSQLQQYCHFRSDHCLCGKLSCALPNSQQRSWPLPTRLQQSPSPVMITTNVPRHYQMVPKRPNCPQLRIIDLQDRIQVLVKLLH